MTEIELLKELVTIPSLSGQERNACDFLKSAMSSLGFEASIDGAGNAVGIREAPDRHGRFTCEIVLLGHIDTVSGAIPVRIENGNLYGRGTVDAKGPLATFVMAVSGTTLMPGTRLVVVGAVEEESATSKGARYAATQYQPDFCVIGEPSGWDGVALGYKGRILLDYELHQPMGHTAGNQQAAAEVAIMWWNALEQEIGEFNSEKAGLFNQLLPSLRRMQSHTDGLMETAELTVGMRLPPEFDIDRFKQRAVQLAGDATLRFHAYEPAFHNPRTSLLARTFNQVLRQAGVRPRFKLKTGTSDMNVVGPVWKCPVVAYGPGDSSLDHTPNEHISLKEYSQAISILQRVLSQIISSESQVLDRSQKHGEMK
ncbi:MAG: [LysW]-lysine hydrolase [Candidatus Promineifilaceae bacterium]|nr:[LysW]-lysine hydrolase [Candidatus Promineifilaceae bacterium]